MSLFLFMFAGGAATITLSGASVSQSSSVAACKAGIRINSDGTVDKREGDTYTQISADTDWIIPNSLASADYDVRVTNVVWTNGSSFNLVEAGVEDTWIDLSSNREWSVQDANPTAAGIIDVTFDIEIRRGTVTQATGSYSLSVAYDST